MGMVPTPVGYFAASVPLKLASGERRVDSCIVVTSSHNPPDYNGFKMARRGAANYGEQILALHQRIVDQNFADSSGSYTEYDILEDVIRALKETDAETGFAFDGDGDRLGVVTKDGHSIYPDRQLMLFAEEVLSRNKGAQIIYDVKCTRNLAKWVKDKGGEPLMWKTGHSLVKAKLRETGAPLAGEMSGHVFFKDRW
ncbi:phosphomannomutase [Paraburkholderia sp. MM6662-R1]